MMMMIVTFGCAIYYKLTIYYQGTMKQNKNTVNLVSCDNFQKLPNFEEVVNRNRALPYNFFLDLKVKVELH